MTIRVVNHNREARTLYIGRGSKWGNPFRIGKDGDRRQVLEKYRHYLLHSPILMQSLHELDDQILGCVCKPLPCHGDILIELREMQKRGELK